MPMRQLAAIVLVTGAWLWVPLGAVAQTRTALRADSHGPGDLLDRPARLMIVEVSLSEALTTLSEAAGVPIAYSPSLLRKSGRPATCACREVSVAEALDRILTGTVFTYSEMGKQVVVLPRSEPPAREPEARLVNAGGSKEIDMRGPLSTVLVPIMLAAAPLKAQPPQDAQGVAGRVVDQESGAPLADAQVQVLNGSRASTTNADGRFGIARLSAGRHTLVVVRIGYARTTVPVTVEAGKVTELEIKLAASSVRLNDIVVSAEKKEQSVQEIPYSVSVISSTQLAQAKIDKPSDLTGYIPNLVQNFVGTAGYNFISLRGINNASGGPYENAVATYVDGVYVLDPAGLDISFGEIERIEVLRGPQGTLYGRGAMGGVINVITRSPTNISRATFSAEYGNYNATRFVAGFSTPLVRDRLFWSADGVYSRRSGIFRNFPADVPYERDRNIGLNSRLRWVPSTSWSFGANARAHLTNLRGTYALASNPDSALANPFEVSIGPGENEDRSKVYGASFDARYVGSKIEVNSVTGYNRTFRGTGPGGIDVDFTPLRLLTSTYGQPGFTKPGYINKAISEEFRIGSRTGLDSPFSWTVGGYLYTQKNPGRVDVFIDRNFSPFQLDTHSLIAVDIDKEGYAFFGQATYTINRKVDLTFGLRRDRQTTDFQSVTDLVTDGGPSFPGQPVIKQQKSSAWSPKASISYRPTDRFTLYGLFSRGFRAGGVNPAAVTTGPVSDYDAEYTSNFEAGVKVASRDERVRANFTLFLIKWTDGQVSTYDFSTFTATTLNTGRATSKGAEIEFSSIPAKNLQVDWNFGVVDAQYDSLNLSLNPNAPLLLNGNKLVYTPVFTSTPVVQYDVPLGKGNQLSLRGEWRWIGKQYFDLENKIPQKAYSLINARAAFQLKDWEIAVWSKNLNDARYFSYATSFGGTQVLLAYPRTFGVTVTTRLGQ
jgi:iron complex outermembrane receptor protein